MHDDIEDGLTPEERAALAINDDEGAPEEVIPGAEAAATTTDKDEDEGTDKTKTGADDGAAAADDPAPAAAATSSEQPPAAASAPASTEQAAAQSPAPQQAPILVAEAVADADTKLADIASQKDALATKFDDGDITAKEYHAQLDALNKQERTIELAQHKAQLAAEMDEQAKKNAWFAQAQAFATANGYTDQRRLNMLDAEVRAVATAEPNLNGADVLAKAHQNLVEAGLAVSKAAAKPAAAPAKPAAKPEIPPSIHNLPAADVDDTGSGEFAQLDRLATTNPLKYEEMLASMSDAQRERYLAA